MAAAYSILQISFTPSLRQFSVLRISYTHKYTTRREIETNSDLRSNLEIELGIARTEKPNSYRLSY